MQNIWTRINKNRINIIYSHWHIRHKKFFFCINHLVFKWYQSQNCKWTMFVHFNFLYMLCTRYIVLVVSFVQKYCKSSNNMSISLPIAEWLEGHSRKQGVAGSIPGGGIHYHFEIFANGTLFTSRRRPYKWNQAWPLLRTRPDGIVL